MYVTGLRAKALLMAFSASSSLSMQKGELKDVLRAGEIMGHRIGEGSLLRIRGDGSVSITSLPVASERRVFLVPTTRCVWDKLAIPLTLVTSGGCSVSGANGVAWLIC
jgi:hypothetical protein